jgi:hypothetical protein
LDRSGRSGGRAGREVRDVVVRWLDSEAWVEPVGVNYHPDRIGVYIDFEKKAEAIGANVPWITLAIRPHESTR